MDVMALPTCAHVPVVGTYLNHYENHKATRVTEMIDKLRCIENTLQKGICRRQCAGCRSKILLWLNTSSTVLQLTHHTA